MSLGRHIRETVASSRALTWLVSLRFVVFRQCPRLHDLWCIFVSPLFHPESVPTRNSQPGSLDRCGWSAAKSGRRICIFSTNDYGWGGSEVALLRLTEELSHDGEWEILLCMNDAWPRARLLEEIVRRGKFYFYGRRRRSYGLDFRWRAVVRDFSPDFLLMGNGCLFEARRLMQWCIRQAVPFANCLPLFCEDELARFGERNYRACLPHLLRRSRMVFSDNESTFALLRRLFGGECPPCTLISNAPDVDCNQVEDWPTDDGTMRLLCMCRLTSWHKGLDLLVEVLSLSKWKTRPLFVDIYGEGEYAQTIERAIRERGIKATLNGYVEDYAPVIHRHHAGLFCSRMEGTPVVLTSYMLCHRMSIGTPVGGLPQCIVDDETGFMAESVSVEAIDAALERAWNARLRWREMGLAAGRLVRRRVSETSGGAIGSFIRKTLESDIILSKKGCAP